LETRGRLEIRALLATVQGRAAFGAAAAEIDIRSESRGAVEAARGRDGLDQPWEARARYVDGRPGSLGAGTLIAPSSLMSLMFGMTFAVGFVITALPVLAFAVHRISGPYSFT
jgi:hypothetical protein